MWIDDQGVAHTVALPDPTELMSDEFRRSLDKLIDQRADGVSDLLSAEEDAFYVARMNGVPIGAGERDFEGLAPPQVLLDDPVSSLDDLRARILAVDARWRLDVVVALDDYLS